MTEPRVSLLYSMTGYAEIGENPDAERPGLALRVELRSVNSRFLDLVLRMPDELRGAEPALRALLQRSLRRGKVECRVSLDEAGGAAALPGPERVEPLLRAEAELMRRAPHLRGLSVADLWRLAAAQQPPTDTAALSAALERTTERALKQMQEARAAEGGRLRDFLLDRCDHLADWARQAAALAPQAVAKQQERFVSRWNEAVQALGGSADAQGVQERLLQETAAFAIRIDIAEEIGRLQSHLTAIRQALAQGGEVGKRLDFLIQELHREANTLGSKSALLELSSVGVEMKVCIEQMREQVQNLE